MTFFKLQQWGSRRSRRQGNHARDERRWDEAAQHYRRYLSNRPDDFAIWVQYGHVLAEAGNLTAAAAAYVHAYSINPQDADLALCRGHLAVRSGDVSLARDYYRQSFALDGNAHAADFLAQYTASEMGEEPIPESAAPDAAEVLSHVETQAPYAGQLDGWYERTLWGTVIAEDAATHVAFFVGGRRIGQAIPKPQEDGSLAFRTVLDIDPGPNGEGIEVHSLRMPGGDPLMPSPVVLNPPPRQRASNAAAAWSVASEIVKPLELPLGNEVVLFVTHSRTGKIKPHVLPYIRMLKAQGLGIFLIATVDRPLELPADLMNLADAVMVRRNAGYDFGAWSHVLGLHPQLYGASTLYLVNDSMLPATDNAKIGAVVDRVRSSPADLVSLTDSHEWRWHVQSYFLAIKQRFLSSRAFHAFMSDVRILTDKDQVIQAYELALGDMAYASGHAVDVLFPSSRAYNPALFDWRQLVADGMPLVKLLLLRGEFETADIADWQDSLATAGFDIPLVEATLAALAEHGPTDGSTNLLVRRPPASGGAAALRVAFYGPWNYDNGLGHASRGIISAIRRTGVQLNLHPIKRPFHIHKPLTPPVDICDFEGRADIAVIHLNPDSWHLLTAEQQAAIAEARYRIGYWVWEMDHIPTAWRGNFDRVDRIWAPSRYCADLFAAQNGAPVDVVPHVVPIPAALPADRASALARFGLAADRRSILYAFDGSSYLVRKNPAALVRAFSASGLAGRGWSLILKTKHLLDRPEEGTAFQALVDATDAVTLIDRSMSAEELSKLAALADIYASPHCSEGFGLTIAEAMAAGKPVVATDFGGSRDFLDNASGWPVKWHEWRLDRDHGHYTEGGTWARIDEPALTATLIQAADAVEAGDNRKGDAARKRIADRLSPDAVAASVAASFAAMSPAINHEGRWISTSLAAGLPLTDPIDPALHVLPLHSDGSLGEMPDDLFTDPQGWTLIAPHDALLSPLLGRAWREAVVARPDAAIFYGDDFAAGEARRLDQLRLKPAFDLTLLTAQDYIGSPLIVRTDILAELGLRHETGTAVLDDLLFRAHHRGVSIVRIPETLLAFRGTRPRALPDDRLKMLAAQPQLAPFSIRPARVPGTFAQWRNFGNQYPRVSLIIPTCRSRAPGEQQDYVEGLLEAVSAAAWPMENLDVIVGDDVVGSASWAERIWPFTLRRVETPRAADVPFNYAAKMNQLWRTADTEQIIFLNDDVRPDQPGWLKALVGLAIDESVGGVGARLLYPDGRLQHAGVAPQFGGVAHAWAWLPAGKANYQDWALVQREWSMVTGAVFATRKSLMELIGGFDEQFSLEYNDIDLCLRLRSLGYRIISTPEAEMVHAERASRGETAISGAQFAHFATRWRHWLDDDPSWHPGLRRDSFEVMPIDDPWAWYR